MLGFARASLGFATWSALCLLLAAAAAVQAEEVEVKTPPLRVGDNCVFKYNYTSSGVVPNWAGARLWVHVVDNTEADVVGVTNLLAPAFHASPFGGPSDNQASVGQWFTAFHSQAEASGMLLSTNDYVTPFQVTFHAKFTSPAGNSDVDYELKLWNIFHVPASPGGTQLPSSLAVWATPDFVPTNQQPLPSFRLPIDDPKGTFVHIPFPWTVTSLGASNYLARLSLETKLGIEHVPEPASGLLLGMGTLSLALGAAARHRRIRSR